MKTDDDNQGATSLGILAGGAGNRLGGRDKGLVEAGGRRLIEHVRDRLGGNPAETLISANRNLAIYDSLGPPVFTDEVGDEPWPGPLAAVITLLRHCPTLWLQLAPCDAPLLPGELTTRLQRAAGEAPARVPVADGRYQWACSLIARAGLPVLENSFANGTRSLAGALGALDYIAVDFEDRVDAFANINTPEDLATLERRMNGG